MRGIKGQEPLPKVLKFSLREGEGATWSSGHPFHVLPLVISITASSTTACQEAGQGGWPGGGQHQCGSSSTSNLRRHFADPGSGQATHPHSSPRRSQEEEEVQVLGHIIDIVSTFSGPSYLLFNLSNRRGRPFSPCMCTI